jgi:signal transduction histidine kinase
MHRIFLPLIVWIFCSTAFGQNNNKLDILLEKSVRSEDSAAYYFAQAEKLLQTRPDTANYLYYRFYYFQAEQINDSAFNYAERVIPYLEALDSLDRLRKVYERLHFIELRSGQYERAIEYINQALSTAERLKDTAMISLHLSDKSIIYHDFEDYQRGIDYGKQAYRLMDRAKNKQYRYLIYANNAIGINFDDWGKADSALYYHYKNVDLIKKTQDSLRFAFIYNNIGNTNLKQGNYREAEKFIKRALQMNLISQRDYNLASNYTNLATIAYHLNKYDEAENYFKQAKIHADASGSIEKIRDVVQQEAWYYKKKGDFERALEKQEAYYVLRDSVFQNERASRFAELETRYQSEKRERALAETRAELAEKELEVRRKNILVFGGFGLALILALLTYLVYSRQRLKNRQLIKENELKTALARIETQNKLQEQRLRISRDLHDNIGSQLTFVISSLDSLRYGMAENNDTLKERLSRISSFTRETIDELRDTIWAMNKNAISMEDLKSRISNFIDKAKSANSEVRFEFTGSVSITDQEVFSSVVGMNVYRIIQEAVNNALKHAGATLITLKIEATDTGYLLTIKDNGSGFDEINEHSGSGLKNMEKRARDINGELAINPIKGQGTTVELRFDK